MRRTLLIARNELVLMGADPVPIVVLLALPTVLALFLGDGFVGGPVAAVTGLSVLFGALGVSAVGAAFFRDHGWGTWDRLRASPAGHAEVVGGKLAPLVLLFAAQQVTLLVVSRVVFGIPWRAGGTTAALLLAGIVAVELGLGLLLTAFCTTINQVNAIGTVAAAVLAGLGGTLSPVARMPALARAAAHSSPFYWATDGLRSGLTPPGASARTARDAAVLLAFALAALALALWRLRLDESKRFYA